MKNVSLKGTQSILGSVRSKVMCKICKNDNCIGKYLLHPKEIKQGAISTIKANELKENPDREFLLVESPGNLYTKFMELHVIEM